MFAMNENIKIAIKHMISGEKSYVKWQNKCESMISYIDMSEYKRDMI